MGRESRAESCVKVFQPIMETRPASSLYAKSMAGSKKSLLSSGISRKSRENGNSERSSEYQKVKRVKFPVLEGFLPYLACFLCPCLGLASVMMFQASLSAR